MNIITICEGGNVRSVGLARILKNRHHNVVAIGTAHNMAGDEPIRILVKWAELVVLMSASLKPAPTIMAIEKHKVAICEVGPDRYGHHRHHALVALCERWASEQGL